MESPKQTEAGEALTALILDVFRLNGRLLVAGDRLVGGLGLTSARWQVLGAIAYAKQPGPVAWVARSMGLNRQGVQRIVNELEKDGIVAFAPNPNHRRANLVVLTERGKAIYEAASNLQAPWVNRLSDGLNLKGIAIATEVVGELRERLERELGDDP
jgi:DNA-binding MarR family transcriptional regulator